MLKAPGEGRKRLANVLESWGVKFDGTKVAADIRHAKRVQFGPRPGFGDGVRCLAWPRSNQYQQG